MVDGETVAAIDFAKKYADIARFGAAVLAGAFAIKQLALPAIDSYLGERGPAVVIDRMLVEQTQPDVSTLFVLEVSKVRDCRKATPTVVITDAEKREHVVPNSWGRTVLPVRANQIIAFEFEAPKRIALGDAYATLSVAHSECVKGGTLPPIVTIISNKFLIARE